ncbi:flavin reductase family protein [Bacillus inaquosorum]|uniref:flavin reductase family protein n=1 Tax=Bacillus inaquosorum TaxID=483913 RepID=UPI00227EB322|nr:flavin reductase family protein [Bacillus inaquosorum]MCY8164020.1 flavin reductase family protein [Bacillus inaquosorum]MCY8322553.1 flavin reductase family protein [Bacillus inaquosorum]MCY8338639.1 flavin reductase family protein [Bacillus inaquosorum]
MYIFQADQLSAKDTYKLLSGAVIPRPIAFVTTLSSGGTVNAAPFSFYNVVSSDPPLLSISVNRAGGRQKDTARNALENGEFVVHVSDEAIIEDINETAASLGPDESELTRTSLHPVESKSVSVPGINEARIRFECTLERHMTFDNDQGVTTADLLIGRVVCFHLDEKVYDAEKGYVLTDELKPASRLAGNHYAKLGEEFTLVRPS